MTNPQESQPDSAAASSHACFSPERSPHHKHSHPQWRSYRLTIVFLDSEPTLTRKARYLPHGQIKTNCDACAERSQQSHWCRCLAKKHWFYSVPFQRFQALLTLFSKSFSPFPHGTCFLSVSNQYLALDEIYHPLCAPIPRNVTRRRHTVHGGLQMTDGTLTLADALFQEAYICASVGATSRDYNSRPRAPIPMLSYSLFIRHY